MLQTEQMPLLFYQCFVISQVGDCSPIAHSPMSIKIQTESMVLFCNTYMEITYPYSIWIYLACQLKDYLQITILISKLRDQCGYIRSCGSIT